MWERKVWEEDMIAKFVGNKTDDGSGDDSYEGVEWVSKWIFSFLSAIDGRLRTTEEEREKKGVRGRYYRQSWGVHSHNDGL